MPPVSNAASKTELRKHFRQRRQALDRLDQLKASQALFRKLATSAAFKRAKSIAGYLANDGEISPKIVLEHAINTGKKCYLPATCDNQQMEFRLFNRHSRLLRNQYGILEPDPNCRKISPEKLDLVLVPLVAFDSQGNRLGMGGGYYDRAFSFKKRIPNKGPTLIGLAHHCQQATQISTQSWDIGLDYIATDQGIAKAAIPKNKKL